MSKTAGKERGAISRLYREFTDPSASGDTLNMLRKYADGLLPGLMGVLFMGAGTLVIVLFSRQIAASDKKTYLPLLFGAVFFLAGFGVFRLGLSAILKKARSASPATGRFADEDDRDSASQ